MLQMKNATSAMPNRKITSRETPTAKLPRLRREFTAELPSLLEQIERALHDIETGEPRAIVQARATVRDLRERADEHGFEGIGRAAQALADLLERFAEPLAKEQAMQLHASLARLTESMANADPTV